MLQIHNMDDAGIGTQHCSNYYFLHACACGRSRALRDDPFDIETANVKFCVLPKCEGLLPVVEIPSADGVSPVMASAWRLMRIGGAGYYKPENGLLQTGFCTREKYLFQWKIRNTSNNYTNDQSSIVESSETITEVRDMHRLNVISKQIAADLRINFGKGLPSSTTKKPFAEVVAGTVMTDSEFPALQKIHSKPSISNKDTKQNKFSGPGNETKNENKIFSGDVHMVYNVVPVINKVEGTKGNKSMEEFIVCIGFEHECPQGHRFLVSEKHLKGLDSPFFSERNQGKNVGNKKGYPTKVLQSSTAKANKMKEVSVKHSNRPVRVPGMDDDNEKCRDWGRAFCLLNRKLPIFMNCPHCGRSEKQYSQKIKFSGTTSQLQRFFIVSAEKKDEVDLVYNFKFSGEECCCSPGIFCAICTNWFTEWIFPAPLYILFLITQLISTSLWTELCDTVGIIRFTSYIWTYMQVTPPFPVLLATSLLFNLRYVQVDLTIEYVQVRCCASMFFVFLFMH
jgi:protein SMG8